MSKKTQYCPYCGENHTYCIWCGEDLGKGHDKECPLVHGIQTKEGHIAYGFKADPNDIEWNLHLGRLRILLGIWRAPNGKPTVGPSDQEVKMKLIHEQFSFLLYRLNTEMLYLNQKLSNTQKSFLKRIFTSVGGLKKEISKLEKERIELKKYALESCNNLKLSIKRKKYWYEKIEEVYSRGRVLLHRSH